MSVDIEFEWAGQEWTEADSEALDAGILAERERKNPKRKLTKRPDFCKECGRALRSPGQTIPGTVMHKGSGYCTTHYTPAKLRGDI